MALVPDGQWPVTLVPDGEWPVTLVHGRAVASGIGSR